MPTDDRYQRRSRRGCVESRSVCYLSTETVMTKAEDDSSLITGIDQRPCTTVRRSDFPGRG